jgi:chromosomal replication initiator protein
MKTLFPSDHSSSLSSPSFSQRTVSYAARPSLQEASLWPAIKQKLRESLTPEIYATWLAPLEAKVTSEHEVVVYLPNLVFYQGIHDNFMDMIERCKANLGFEHILVRFEVEGTPSFDELASELTSEKITLPTASNARSGATAVKESFVKENFFADSLPAATEPLKEVTGSAEQTEPGQAFSRSLNSEGNLNRNYTFDSFVKGDSNQFAVATCLSAAENPGKAYNPLFIYGSTGLGKTHLLHAVGNRVLQTNPQAVVTYISSERFMNEMIYCLRFNKMWDFRQKYRHCDVFLVDDIQFISNKKATQEEFFHTFNTLYAAKKQIVITSDLFPKDIPDIEDRLRNRFQWGLIADIQPPSIEHRIAILLSKAEKLGIRMREDVAEYIAKHAKRNVRELEGALHRINAFSALQGEEITMDLAVRTFKDVLGEPPKRLTIEIVQKIVADHFKLRVTDLKSKRRQRALAHPRQIAMYLARKLTNSSFPEIGDKFGGKDHTTVMHNVRKIEDCLTRDLDLKAHVEALERQIEQLQ